MAQILDGAVYQIEAVDKFTKTFVDFLDGIEAIKKEVAGLNSALRPLQKMGDAFAAIADAANKTKGAHKDVAARLEAITQAAEARRKEENKAADAIQRQRVEFAAARKEADALAKSTAAAARNAQVMSTAQVASQRQQQRELRKTTNAQREAQRALESQGTTLLQLARTFVLYRVFRDTLLGIRDAFIGGIGFNAEIETATIGIASLLAATGDVRDSLGQSVDTATEFELAIGLAADQIEKLRIEALKTPATFRELLEAFQVSIGPGLAAGLDPDQIRKFAAQVSQAARAIGLPQQQLAEEIRSLFQGTITPRATRIATVLGIKNEDIRNWTRAGVLIENLRERFNSFSAASRASERTLAGVWARYTDALQESLRQGLDPLFVRLKEVIEIGRGQLLLPDNTINPKIVLSLREISTAAEAVIDGFSKFGSSIGSDRLVRAISTISQGIGTIIGFGADAATSFAVSFDSATRLVKVIVDIVDLFGRIGGLIPTNLLASALGLMLGIQGAAKITAFLAKQLYQTWNLITGKALVAYIRNLAIANGEQQKGLSISKFVGRAFTAQRAIMRELTAQTGLWNKTLAASSILWGGMKTAALSLTKALIGVASAFAALFIIDQIFALFAKFTGTDKIEDLNKEVQKTGAILVPATKATELFAEAWETVTKSVEEAKKQLALATAAARVEGTPARSSATALAEQEVDYANQIRTIDQEIVSLQRAKTGQLEKSAQAYREILTSQNKLFRDLFADDRFNEALRERVRLETQRKSLEKEIEQAREDGTLKEISKVRDLEKELASVNSRREETLAIIEQTKNRAADLAALGAESSVVGLGGSAALAARQTEARNEAAKAVDEYTKKLFSAIEAESIALAIGEQQSKALEDQASLRQKMVGLLTALKVQAEQADRSKELVDETTEINRQADALNRVVTALEAGDEISLVDAEAANDIDDIRARYRKLQRELRSESQTYADILSAAVASGLDGAELDTFKAFIERLRSQLSGLSTALVNKETAEIAERQARAAAQAAKSTKDTRDFSNDYQRFLSQGVKEANNLRREFDQITAASQRSAIDFRAEIASQAGNNALAARLRAEGELFDLELRRGEIQRRQEDTLAEIAKRESDIQDSKVSAEQKTRLLADLEGERALAAENTTAEYALLTQQLQQQKRLLENLRAREGNPVATGLFDAGLSLNRGLEERSREFFSTLGSAFAGSVSDALFDALDPANAQTIGERVTAFLQAVGGTFVRGIVEELAGLLFKSIATSLVPALTLEAAAAQAAAAPRIASAGAIVLASELELANAKAAAAVRLASLGAGLPLPFQRGGPVPRGYASGGAVNSLPRPSSIPASDTIPAWLTPGEWIAPVKTVRRYSMEFLEALRQGTIDPAVVRGLMQGRARAAKRAMGSSRVRGYAAGGVAQGGSSGSRSGGGSAPAVAVIVPSEQSLEAQLARGDRAMREWMRRNKSFLASLL